MNNWKLNTTHVLNVPFNKEIILKLFFFVLIAFGTSFQTMAQVRDAPGDGGINTGDGEISTRLWTRAEIDAYILDKLETTGDFAWTAAPNIMIQSALALSGGEVAIGYSSGSEGDGDGGYQNFNRSSGENTSSRNAIISILNGGENRNQEGGKNPIREHAALPYLFTKITDASTIVNLKGSPYFKNIDLLNFDAFQGEGEGQTEQRSLINFGCNATQTGCDDCTETTPATTQVPWNYHNMKIPGAWNYSSGEGIKIGLIDVGLSENQDHLTNIGFNGGESQNRSLEVVSTYPGVSSGYNGGDCAHGTQMAGTIAGPKRGNNTTTGIAFNSDLRSVRGNTSVLLTGKKNKEGVADAILDLANDPDVKIISMSLGTVIKVGIIEDAVKTAYANGKLMFAAAGTTPAFLPKKIVIFPARMSQVYACTGVKSNYGYGYNGFEACEKCHYAGRFSKSVSFAVPMERHKNDKNLSYTLHTSGTQASEVGGSSIATATMAGIAALVWSNNPSDSRNEIVEKLRRASTHGNAADDEFGWGVVDAEAAVQGVTHINNYPALTVSIGGPSKVYNNEVITWTAHSTNAQGNTNFSFSHSNNDPNISLTGCSQNGDSYTCTVNVLSENDSGAAETVINLSVMESAYPNRSKTTQKGLQTGPIQ